MITDAHPPSGLSKATWTETDFQVMGWHDSRVHAISIGEYEDDTVPPARLLLDLDYIVRWVEPAPPARHFTFWITPSTLVFDKAWSITGDFGPVHEPLEIADIHRLDPPDSRPDPLWHIEGHNFSLRLRANGFRQHLRLPPRNRVCQQNGVTGLVSSVLR